MSVYYLAISYSLQKVKKTLKLHFLFESLNKSSMFILQIGDKKRAIDISAKLEDCNILHLAQ